MTAEPTIEEPKPADPRHIRQDFYHLTLDWIHLHTQLPTPTASQGRRAKTANTATLHNGRATPPPKSPASSTTGTTSWQNTATKPSTTPNRIRTNPHHQSLEIPRTPNRTTLHTRHPRRPQRTTNTPPPNPKRPSATTNPTKSSHTLPKQPLRPQNNGLHHQRRNRHHPLRHMRIHRPRRPRRAQLPMVIRVCLDTLIDT